MTISKFQRTGLFLSLSSVSILASLLACGPTGGSGGGGDDDDDTSKSTSDDGSTGDTSTDGTQSGDGSTDGTKDTSGETDSGDKTGDTSGTSDDNTKDTDSGDTGDTGGDSSTSDPGDSTSGEETGDNANCGADEGVELSDVSFGSIPKWKNNAKGAYTIFHDDTCWDYEESHSKVAAPELNKRGLIGAFGLVAVGCDGWDEMPAGSGNWEKSDWDQWDSVRGLIDHGHEIVNHSFNHLTIQDGAYSAEKQIDQASEIMRKALPDVQVDFYIFPQDLFADEHLSRLEGLDYLGARAGTKGQYNSAGSYDPFRMNFDVHASPTGVGANQHQLIELDEYVDQAISNGTYAIREFHAVVDSLPSGDSTWMIALNEYTEHLDHVEEKVKSGDLWITGPAMVIRYHAASEACPEPKFKDGVISWGSLSDECKRNSEPLSYPIEASGDFKNIGAEQDGMCIEGVENDGVIYLNLNPSKGDAKVWGIK